MSVFTAEAIAILCAIQWVGKIWPQQALICADSAAVLMALQAGGSRARSDVIFEILIALHRAKAAGLTVAFMWVPAHVGLAGNEMADTIAKEAQKLEDVTIRRTLGYIELCSIIHQKVMSDWQRVWDSEKRGRQYYAMLKRETSPGKKAEEGKLFALN